MHLNAEKDYLSDEGLKMVICIMRGGGDDDALSIFLAEHLIMPCATRIHRGPV